MRFHCIIATSLLIITPMGGYLLSASESSGSFPSAGTQVEKILLKGKVTDEHGEPLAGAMVMLKGTTTGTMTDSDGRYELLVPQGKKDLSVIFSYLGMVQQEHPFTGQAVLNIQMVADNEIEAAVIDVGYGLLQKREDLTGSAFEVKSVDIAKKPAARIDNLLAGIVPGLVVNEDKSSGRTKVSIRIRGEGSLSASCEPLWIIDGIPVYTGSSTNSVYGTSYSVSPLSFLNPDDIESMTVLKDAATTTIYGADGANGVILVNTKKAQSGKTVYNASVRYGISRVDRSTTLKVLNADQWWQV
ncbi:MAG: TonB-dependent receptor plug domain-containing protein, partial [Candidatus Cryptobacteroides sp.]